MDSEDHMPGPVCLIENVKGQLVTNQEALRILSAIKQPVVVVAIVGLYRTGKSHLMNRLAGKNTGERVKPEAAQAAAKLPKEMQLQNEQLMQRKEKSYQERGKRLREVEKEKARMREEQQRITEHRKQARLLQKGFQKEAKRLEEERICLQQKKPKHKRHRKLWF